MEWVWRGGRWTVYRQTLVSADREDWLRIIAPDLSDLTAFQEELRAVGGAFFPAGDQPTREWELADPDEAERFFADVLGVDVGNPNAVAGLVDRWGHLGVTLPIVGDRPVFCENILESGGEAFLGVRHELESVQYHFGWLQELKEQRLGPHIPRLTNPMGSRLERWSRRWEGFLSSLEEHLRPIAFTARWDSQAEAVDRAWTIDSPNEILWAKLWELATRGGQLRRCEWCKLFFEATDPRKRFCKKQCASRAGASRWYHQTGKTRRVALRRLRAGEAVTAVAKKCRLPLELVRKMKRDS